MDIDQKELDKLIKKNVKSKFQNCFQCEWFPKDISKSIFIIPYKSIGWSWGVENVESLEFRCKYLSKKTSQAIKPVQTNHCMCFRKEEAN